MTPAGTTAGGRRKRRPDLPGRIVVAAVGLFDVKGYAGTSMEEIAAAVGLTAGALYQHFRDKQAILEAAVEAAAGRQHQTLEGEEDARARLVGLAERLVYLAATESALLSVARHDRHLAGESAQARARTADEAVAAAWLDALRACRPHLSATDGQLTIRAVLGAAYSPTHTVSPLQPERRAALLTAGVVAALLGDTPPPRASKGIKRKPAAGGRSTG